MSNRSIHILQMGPIECRVLVTFDGHRVKLDGWFPNRDVLNEPFGPVSLWWSELYHQIQENFMGSASILTLITRVPQQEPEVKSFQLNS